MTAGVARADVVGSLLRPPYLKDARQGARAGTVSDADLRAAEDRAVREAIALQESTKLGALEDAALVETRIREAAREVPLERLALSPQCGFASGEAGNPLTPAEQEAKLRLVGTVARQVWAS